MQVYVQVYEPLYHWLHVRPGTPGWVVGIALALLAVAAIWVAVVDLRTLIIPNTVTYPLLLLFLLAAPLLWENWVTHLIAGVGVGLFFFAVIPGLFAILPAYRGKEVIGMGDVKLYTIAGLALGGGVLVCVMVSCLSGLIWVGIQAARGTRREQFPFGPHITVGILVTMALGLQGALS